MIDINVRPRSRIEEFFHKLRFRLDKLLFTIVKLIPERFLPQSFMEWMSDYLDKRIYQMQQQTIQMRWHNLDYEDAHKTIQELLQDENKAPLEE